MPERKRGAAESYMFTKKGGLRVEVECWGDRQKKNADWRGALREARAVWEDNREGKDGGERRVLAGGRDDR